MLATSAIQQASNLSNGELNPLHRSARPYVALYFREYGNHLPTIFLAVSGRVQEQEETVERLHCLRLLPRGAQACDPGELFHAAHFFLKIPAPKRRESIGLLGPRTVFLLKTYNPAVFEQPP